MTVVILVAVGKAQVWCGLAWLDTNIFVRFRWGRTASKLPKDKTSLKQKQIRTSRRTRRSKGTYQHIMMGNGIRTDSGTSSRIPTREKQHRSSTIERFCTVAMFFRPGTLVMEARTCEHHLPCMPSVRQVRQPAHGHPGQKKCPAFSNSLPRRSRWILSNSYIMSCISATTHTILAFRGNQSRVTCDVATCCIPSCLACKFMADSASLQGLGRNARKVGQGS
jgi:hypothetical protein